MENIQDITKRSLNLSGFQSVSVLTIIVNNLLVVKRAGAKVI